MNNKSPHDRSSDQAYIYTVNERISEKMRRIFFVYATDEEGSNEPIVYYIVVDVAGLHKVNDEEREEDLPDIVEGI